MVKFKKVISRPRNIYLSLVVMLTITAALASISFSYYVGESKDKSLVLAHVDNRISCDVCADNKVTVDGLGSYEFTIYVMSNTSFASDYELYYKANLDNVIVKSPGGFERTIDAYDVHEIKIVIENNELQDATVELAIISGYTGKELKIPGKRVIKE